MRPCLLLLVVLVPLDLSAGALAAPKGKRKPSGKGGGGGFGKKPVPEGKKTATQSLAQVCKSFPNRLPGDDGVLCPCGSTTSYADCCQPYHQGTLLPDSPLAVLQSRYAAFAYRLPGHLIRTTARSNRDWRPDEVAWARSLNREGMFDDFVFVGLDAGAVEPGDSADEAYIDFSVRMRPRDGGAEIGFRERSRFVRAGEGWLYASGEVGSDDAGLDGAVLNR